MSVGSCVLVLAGVVAFLEHQGRGEERRPPPPRRSVRAAIALLLAGLSAGCSATLAHNELLRKRGSFDLECPDDDLSIEETGRRSAVVSGCGGRAAYVWDEAKKAWVAAPR